MRLIGWMLSMLVFVFAAYSFFVMPIGRHTMYGHVRAIAASAAARDLMTDLRATFAARLRQAAAGR